MAANTTVLIVVAAMATLLLAGMVAGVAYMTRTQQRHFKAKTIRAQAEEDARQAIKAHTARAEVTVKVAQAPRLQRHTEKPLGTTLPPATPRFAAIGLRT
jgi:type II secretory pathway component PulK